MKLISKIISQLPRRLPTEKNTNMKITIVNFREYNNYEIIIPNKGITLLNGESGTGKTTIIRAIRWCIFGGSAFGEKYHVKIAYKKITIIRQSKPKTIEVITNGNTFNGGIAEQIIVDNFGSEELFDLCCYMKQSNTPCPLLTSANKERLRYLSKFSFRDESDPIIILEAIHNRLKKIKEKHLQLKKAYKDKKNLLVNFEEEMPLDGKVFDWKEDDIKGEIEIYYKDIEETENAAALMEKQKTIISQLTKQKKTLEINIKEKIELIKKYEEEIAGLRNSNLFEEKLEFERVHVDMLNKIKIIEHSLEQLRINALFVELDSSMENLLKLKLEATFRLEEREYYTLELQHQQYQENKKECDRLGVTYEKESVAKKIKFLKDYEEYKDNKIIHQRKVEIERQLIILVDDPLFKELNSKKETIVLHEMKKSLELHKCPHCDGLLRYGEDGTLIAATSAYTVKVTKEDIKKQSKLIKELEDREKSLQNLEANLRTMKVTNFSINDEFEHFTKGNTIKQDINSLMKIKVIDIPKYTIEKANLLFKYSKKEKEIKSLTRPDPAFILSLDSNKNMIEQLNSLQKEQKHVEQILFKMRDVVRGTNPSDILEQKLNSAKSIEKNLQEQSAIVEQNLIFESSKLLDENYDDKKRILNEKISSAEKRLSMTNRAALVIEKRKSLSKDKKELEERKTNLVSLINLYENAVHEHHDHLQRVINSINICIADGIDKFFPYPLTIALNLVSADENEEKKYKKQITYTIFRKGKDKSGRNPEEIFSGGEMKRMVLLIIIALNTLYKSKILLFDEIFASLNVSMRDECLKVIKQYLGNRTIISAEHYAERGDYDHCVDVMPTNG